MAEPVFKEYNQHQASFLPPSLQELIGEEHQARFINKVIDEMDISEIIATYKGGGTSSYHPRMMLKVLIYGYVQRVDTARTLAKAVRENIVFMWLAGMQRPDFRTINDFRKRRLPGGGVKAIFTQVMWLLVEKGLVDLADYNVDGTTLEANARKHSAVWATNSKRYRHKCKQRIGDLFDEIQRLADLEDRRYGDRDLDETGEQSDWNSRDVQEAVEQVDQALAEQAEHEQTHQTEKAGDNTQNEQTGRKTVDKKELSKAQTRLRWIREKELPKLKKYERQQQTLGERNSYSKTDPDATFMRLKDQSPFDKLLSPAYNLQMGTQNQFILGYSLHSNAADKVNLKSHLDQLNFTPERLCADAGYGTLANFQMLDNGDIHGVVKYPGCDKKATAYSRDNFVRSPQTDSYRCPQGRTMQFKETQLYEYGDGKTTPMRTYECVDCSDCPVKSECTKTQGNRTISFITKLEQYKRQMKARMSDPADKKLMRGRGAEIEAVFGQLKYNDRLRRLRMRGQQMVELEVGLKAIAHNLRKMEKTLKMKQAEAIRNLTSTANLTLAA